MKNIKFISDEDECNNYLRDLSSYGTTAKEWIDRWDANKPIISVSMGGLGYDYELVIQIMAAEML